MAGSLHGGFPRLTAKRQGACGRGIRRVNRLRVQPGFSGHFPANRLPPAGKSPLCNDSSVTEITVFIGYLPRLLSSSQFWNIYYFSSFNNQHLMAALMQIRKILLCPQWHKRCN
jgi:hypothetical protein